MKQSRETRRQAKMLTEFSKELNWDVQVSPVMYQHNGESLIDPAYNALVRTDNGNCLSVNKSSYAPMYVKDFAECTNRMLEASGFEFNGYQEGRGGRVLISVMKNNIEQFEINGHKIDDYLMMGTSFDYSYPFFVGTTTVLLRCENQFSKIREVASVKHYKNGNVKRENLFQELEQYFLNRKKMYETFNKMATYEIVPELRDKAIRYILGMESEEKLSLDAISSRKLNKLDALTAQIDIESRDLGNTAWALFNGVTRYTTHELTGTRTENTFGNIFGSANWLNQRAYNFAAELVS